MKRVIFVYPYAGLCNRMRVMVSAIALARETNSKLVFFWQRGEDLNASFCSLFEKIPYTVIDFHRNSIIQRLLFKLIGKVCNVIGDDYIREVCKPGYKDGLKNIDWFVKKASRLWFFLTCEQIYPSFDFSIFRIKESLIKRIPEIDSANTIGIHIRRTDNLKSVECSPTSLFIEAMEQYIREDSTVKFFLSTDDQLEEKTLIDHFGNRIITYTKRSLSRNSQEGIEDALIDLYSLARCKKIIGSYFSSFSDVAAWWGNIDKIIIKK